MEFGPQFWQSITSLVTVGAIIMAIGFVLLGGVAAIKAIGKMLGL